MKSKRVCPPDGHHGWSASRMERPGRTPAAKSLLDEIQERGKMRVGAECLYKGTCYVDPDSGERTGYSVDLAALMATDLGVEIEWVDLEWGALIPAIETGTADIIMMGMTNTPDRAKVVEMSRPMDYYPGVLVMPADSPLHDLTSLDQILAELNKPGAHGDLFAGRRPGANHRPDAPQRHQARPGHGGGLHGGLQRPVGRHVCRCLGRQRRTRRWRGGAVLRLRGRETGEGRRGAEPAGRDRPTTLHQE